MSKSGHIIIELLLSIVVFATIMLIILQVIMMLKAEISISRSNIDELLLVKKAQEDLIFCKKVKSWQPFVCELYNEKSLKYEMKNKNLIRSVDNKGYEVVANKIDKLKIVSKNPLMLEIQKSRKTTNLTIGVQNE